VITIIDKNEIIIRHKNGQSIKLIAKNLGIARNTVRAYIREFEASIMTLSQTTDKSLIVSIQESICSKPSRKQYNKVCSAFTPEVEKRFNELIKMDEKRNELLGINKQQLTAALLHRTLLSEGYKIGETTIRDKYRAYKEKYHECFIKQYYPLGEIAQYDFHQIKIILANECRVFHQATISIPKSNIIFGVLYLNEKMESFIDSLVQFFHFCHGIFKKIIFDNMSNVVKRFCYKNGKEYTDELIKLSNYYGFQIETCNPRSGNEKGHVENSGKVIRRDFFCLKYQFDTMEDLYLYYEDQLQKRNAPYLEGFKEEQKHLLPLPPQPYELGRLQYAKVNSYSLISIDNNFYSVPDKYVEKQVTCNIYTQYLVIYDDKSNLIAQHDKLDGKGKYAIDIKHYIETLVRKPKALNNSYALKQAPQILQTIFNKHFKDNPKDFLHFLIDTDAFNDDLHELGIEVGTIKKSKYRKTQEFFHEHQYNDIDKLSMKQLSYTSNLFGQEVHQNE
jgi:transposase